MADNLIQSGLINSAQGTLALKKGLDAWAARQRAHAQNVANAETPGYKRVVVDFESKLREALRTNEQDIVRTHPRHLPSSSSELENMRVQIRREPIDPDGSGISGVDIDREMAEMAETQLRYITAVELLKRKYEGIKGAIRGSGL